MSFLSIFPLPHDIVTFLSASIVAVMGAVLLGIRVPRNRQWGGFRRMRLILALSYFVLSGSAFASSVAQVEEESPSLLSAFTLIVAGYQALLFTATTVTFVSPRFVCVRSLLWQLAAVTLLGASLLAVLAFAPRLFGVAFALMAVGYVAQLAAYLRLFRRRYAQCVARLEAHYDEDESGRLRWIVRCFYSALGVGVLALAFAVLPMGLAAYDGFTAAYTLYYVYMACCVVNYRVNNSFIVRVAGAPVAGCADAADDTVPAAGAADPREALLEASLRRWVEAKMFLATDVTSDEVAAQLGTTRRYLAWYFSTRRQTSFRSWRLSLRIAEAERLLREGCGVSVAALHRLVGVSDKSNFHKQFRQTTGMTPSEYKDRFGRV